MNLTFLGTNTLLLEKATSRLMIDPHFSRPGLLQLLDKNKPDRARISSALKAFGISELNGVLLTHTHYDHAMDAAEVINQVGGILYGSDSAANLAKGAGFSKEKFLVVDPKDNAWIGAFNVTWFESQHISFPPPLIWFMPINGRIDEPIMPPLHFWQYKRGEVYAILIDNLLVFGSAGFIPNAYKGCDPKAVVLSIGGLETKSSKYLEVLYEHTVVQTGAHQVLVSHWDNFFRTLEKPIHPIGFARHTIRKIKQLGARYGQSIDVLLPGERIEI